MLIAELFGGGWRKLRRDRALARRPHRLVAALNAASHPPDGCEFKVINFPKSWLLKHDG